MLQEPRIVSLSLGGCESMMMTEAECRAEVNNRINALMRELYSGGCRRFRVVPLPRTGDPLRFKVMGWLN